MNALQQKKSDSISKKDSPLNVDDEFRIQMQKEKVLHELREKGYRITKQRLIVLDVILSDRCSSCKEIMYKVSKLKKKIGLATIYRTINMLEEIGAINRKREYSISSYSNGDDDGSDFVVTLQDGTERYLTQRKIRDFLQKGMSDCGYLDKGKMITAVYQR